MFNIVVVTNEIVLINFISITSAYILEYYNRYLFQTKLKLFKKTKLNKFQNDRCVALLDNILPKEISKRVLNKDMSIDYYDSVTFLHSDIVSFTDWCSTKSSKYIVKIVNVMFQ